MKRIAIYTDGACSGNPGPGGWGAVLLYGTARKELSGGEAETTNNRMELTAAIMAIKAVKEPCEIDLYTDSAYLCNAFNKKWIDHWVVSGWQTSSKKPVENQDLWKELLALNKQHVISFYKVKGHADNQENNCCDMLARTAIKQMMLN